MTWLNVEGLERYRVTHKKVHSLDVIYLEHVISQKSAIHTKVVKGYNILQLVILLTHNRSILH